MLVLRFFQVNIPIKALMQKIKKNIDMLVALFTILWGMLFRVLVLVTFEVLSIVKQELVRRLDH